MTSPPVDFLFLIRNESRQEHRDLGLARLAERQHGVVSTTQLLGEVGFSRRGVARAVEAGRLHRVHRAVYAVGRPGLSDHGICMAAVLACGTGALLSHHSAAWLWGIARWSPAPIHVTTPMRRRPHPPLRVHHSTVITVEDRDCVEGIPVAALPRVLLDMAASVGERVLLGLIKRSEEERLFDLAPLDALFARCGNHPGRGRLEAALDHYRPPAFTRSQLEASFLEAVLRHRLPRPRVNYVVLGFELDLYWPERRLAVELDVFETHGSRESFESDRFRQEELLLHGIETIRITGRRFEREPDAVIARLRRLLEGRGP
jgi:very-short-patch-repair endonuclease